MSEPTDQEAYDAAAAELGNPLSAPGRLRSVTGNALAQLVELVGRLGHRHYPGSLLAAG